MKALDTSTLGPIRIQADAERQAEIKALGEQWLAKATNRLEGLPAAAHDVLIDAFTAGYLLASAKSL
jgi:hypothetical protein